MRNDVPDTVSAPLTRESKAGREYLRKKTEDTKPQLRPASPKNRPVSYRDPSPLIRGLGHAGNTILKAVDLPNRIFGNTRSRLQDWYETSERNIAKITPENQSTVDKVIETAASVAPLGGFGKGVPLLFGAAAGTDMADMSDMAGVRDASGRAARKAVVDTGIWSAGINLGSKALPPHLQWLSPYITGIVKNLASTADTVNEARELGYDVDMKSALVDSGKIAAILPMLGGVREIGRLKYRVPGSGREVSLQQFSQKFADRIKARDVRGEDATRIANEYIDMVEKNPGEFIAQVSPEGKALQKFTGLLVSPVKKDSSGHVVKNEHGDPVRERSRLLDPKGQTGADAEAWANDDVKSWYTMYEKVIGSNGLAELRELTSVEHPTPEQKARMTELITAPARSDFRVTGTDPATGQYLDETVSDFIGGLATQDSELRNQSIQRLASFLKDARHYDATEKAIVLQAATKYGVRGDRLVSITDSNVQQPTIVDDGNVAAIVKQLRDDVPVKKALVAKSEAPSGKLTARGVPADYTGWKLFKKSGRSEDIAALAAACAGSKGNWCTGSGAAGSQLPYGDFHVHFSDGEPDIAVRMTDNIINEVRGSDTGQRLFPKEAAEAERYIKELQASGYDAKIDPGFWADQAFRRKLEEDDVTWRDVWKIGDRPAFSGAAGEMGAENSWPPYAKKVIARVLNESRDERLAQGYVTRTEFEGDFSAQKTINDMIGSGKLTHLTFRPADEVQVPLDGPVGMEWKAGKVKLENAVIRESGTDERGNSFTRKWDPNGTKTYESGYDEHGNEFERKWDPNGTQTYDFGTDERGNRFTRGWDPNGTQVLDSGTDEHGNAFRRAWDSDGRPVDPGLPFALKAGESAKSLHAAEKSQPYTKHRESTAPTQEQLEEAVEFLHTVLEIGAPQNKWEQNVVKRILTVLEKAVEVGRSNPAAEEAPAEKKAPTEKKAPVSSPEEVQGDFYGGAVSKEEEDEFKRLDAEAGRQIAEEKDVKQFLEERGMEYGPGTTTMEDAIAKHTEMVSGNAPVDSSAVTGFESAEDVAKQRSEMEKWAADRDANLEKKAESELGAKVFAGTATDEEKAQWNGVAQQAAAQPFGGGGDAVVQQDSSRFVTNKAGVMVLNRDGSGAASRQAADFRGSTFDRATGNWSFADGTRMTSADKKAMNDIFNRGGRFDSTSIRKGMDDFDWS